MTKFWTLDWGGGIYNVKLILVTPLIMVRYQHLYAAEGTSATLECEVRYIIIIIIICIYFVLRNTVYFKLQVWFQINFYCFF